MTAPDMVSVIAAALAEHIPGDTIGQYADGGVFEGEILCSCGHVTKYTGELDFDDKAHAAHQARAVLDAISKAGTVQFGVKGEGRVKEYGRDRRSAQLDARRRRATFVSRLTFPWERAE